MKKSLVLLFLAAACCAINCKNPVQQKNPNYEKFFENPVTITWRGDSKEVESYQANVQVFTMNNRTDTTATLDQTYRIAMSTKNDRVLTRIDLDFDDIPYRTVISDGEDTIVFNPVTEEIGFRMRDPNAQSPL